MHAGEAYPTTPVYFFNGRINGRLVDALAAEGFDDLTIAKERREDPSCTSVRYASQ